MTIQFLFTAAKKLQFLFGNFFQFVSSDFSHLCRFAFSYFLNWIINLFDRKEQSREWFVFVAWRWWNRNLGRICVELSKLFSFFHSLFYYSKVFSFGMGGEVRVQKVVICIVQKWEVRKWKVRKGRAQKWKL